MVDYQKAITSNSKEMMRWYALRDLKRPNDPNRAYKMLEKRGFEVFTPLESHLVDAYGRHLCVDRPLFPDMLFVHSSRESLDPFVESISTLQYRLRIGYKLANDDGVMIIDDVSMTNFRVACESDIRKEFLSPSDIDPSMIGRRVRIFSNAIPDGFEGNLLRVRGRGLKVIVSLPSMIEVKLSLAKNDVVQLLPKTK